MTSWSATYSGKPVLAVVHTETAPSDDEWRTFLERDARILLEPKAVGLAITDGGAPTSTQRRGLVELGYKRPVISVITRSLVARGAVTALSWFDYDIAAFAPEKADEAFAHMGVPADGWARLLEDVKANAERLGRVATVRQLARRA